MRTTGKRQVLTTGIVNYNNVVIPNGSIDWSEFELNPVLLYNESTEGHRGKAVGRVVDIEREGDAYTGVLEFMENVDAADVAFEKYSQGVVPHVSVGGYAQGEENSEGVFVCSRYVPREVSLVTFPANIQCKPVEASEDSMDKDNTRYVVLASEVTPEPAPEPIDASEGEPKRKMTMPAGMSWHDRVLDNQTISRNMPKTFKEIMCDEAFKARLNSLNSAFRSGATSADNNPDNVETVRLLASAMLSDERMVVLANACNFTNGITRERKNGLKFLVECAAGGAAAATLTAADLGVIKWMSLFLEKLLPDNTFMRSIRFVPMSDREGAIYVESGVNPATYVGSTTPVNAQRYFYDDIKRTIARQVFSIQPITFQYADMAILAYDKQSWGWSIAIDSLMSDVATYILQVAASTDGVTVLRTTGGSFSSKGLFPIEAPASNVNIKGISSDDITMTVGAFLTQNYRLNDRKVEIVIPSNLLTKLATDPTFKTLLTPHLSGSVGSGFEYNGSRICGRNPVARFNTTANKVELDPAMYADGTVDSADGSINAITAAVTTANHVGAAVAFVEGEIIAGVGSIDVVVMPDPVNYGITMSGWMSAGATVARENGKGVAVIAPAVQGVAVIAPGVHV